jgi:hypothetical protein
LIEHNVDYEPRTVTWFTTPVEAESEQLCQALGETVGVHYMVYDHNDAVHFGQTPRSKTARRFVCRA